MPLASLLINWQPRRWWVVLGLASLSLGHPAGATEPPLPGPAISAAEPEPSLGSPYVAVSLGPTLASFFSRPLVGGSLAVAGGAMFSSSLGVLLQSRVDIGGLDLRYLTVGSGRLGLALLGRLNERATLTGGVNGGLLGFVRNSTRTPVLTPLVAIEFGADIDLVHGALAASGERYRASGRLFLPISLSLQLMPLSRDGFLDASARLGLGYRYR